MGSEMCIRDSMLALQKSLLEQTDITPVLKEFDFVTQGPNQAELIVTNPPTVQFDRDHFSDKDA